jgi:hypothetical protein
VWLLCVQLLAEPERPVFRQPSIVHGIHQSKHGYKNCHPVYVARAAQLITSDHVAKKRPKACSEGGAAITHGCEDGSDEVETGNATNSGPLVPVAPPGHCQPLTGDRPMGTGGPAACMHGIRDGHGLAPSSPPTSHAQPHLLPLFDRNLVLLFFFFLSW